jgi:hypothetical protein
VIGVAPRDSKATARAMLNFAVALGARTRQEVYLSTPITTGDTYVRWRQETARSIGRDDPRYDELHRAEVINRNIARAAPLAERLRAEFPSRIVVNPADMADIEDWTQGDYHDFWCAVIRQFVEIVIFADGWQFSHGCVTEFATAVECGAQLLNQNLVPLTSEGGSALVAKAMAELDGLSEDTDSLRRALARLNRRRS